MTVCLLLRVVLYALNKLTVQEVSATQFVSLAITLPFSFENNYYFLQIVDNCVIYD